MQGLEVTCLRAVCVEVSVPPSVEVSVPRSVEVSVPVALWVWYDAPLWWPFPAWQGWHAAAAGLSHRLTTGHSAFLSR